MKERDKKLIAMFLMLCIGFSAGYIGGASQGIKWAIRLGLHFLKLNGYEIEPDTEEILFNVQNYKENMNRCYPDIQLEGGVE